MPNPFEVPIIEFHRNNNDTIIPYIENLIEYLDCKYWFFFYIL